MTELREVLPAIVFALRYDDLGDESWITWMRCAERWKVALTQEHSGDCTNECHSCLRCQAEDCARIAEMIEEGLKDG